MVCFPADDRGRGYDEESKRRYDQRYQDVRYYPEDRDSQDYGRDGRRGYQDRPGKHSYNHDHQGSYDRDQDRDDQDRPPHTDRDQENRQVLPPINFCSH